MKDNRSIYFDNAATSWPKPEEVYEAAGKVLRYSGSNPGRSAHTRSIQAERIVFEARERAASFLGAEFPEEIIFTLNATDSLNMAIKGVLEQGDHVIYTSMEHNSVLRPLGSQKEGGGITTTMVSPDADGFLEVEKVAEAIKPETKMIICTHASNIIGSIMPAAAIANLAKEKDIVFLLDAAQTAGSLPLNLQKIRPHLAAFTGHKSLLGPPGVGLLYVCKGLHIKPWREGGTGSSSEEERQPQLMPDYLEAGTMNTPGLAGLNEGIKFIQEQGVSTIRQHDLYLLNMLREGLKKIEGTTVYGSDDTSSSVAVVSFTVEGMDSGELGYILEEVYGILCRTGLHCAPQAHRTIGTFPQGTVRFSPGYFNTEEEVEYVLESLRKITVSFK